MSWHRVSVSFGLVVGICAVGWIWYIWVFPPGVLTLTVDDSWYYLTIARNAAQGHGLTFDRVNPTDGFHPLWLILLTGVQWLTGPVSVELLMRLILTFQLGLLLMALVWLGRVAQRLGTAGRIHGWSCVLLILINFLAVKVFVNGQESALQLLFLVGSLALYVQMLGAAGSAIGSEGKVRAVTGGGGPSTAGFLLLGLGTAGLFLARLDGVFFLGGVVLIVGLESIAGRARWHHFGALALGMLPLVVTYLIWHYLTFGHWLTVSGAIKAGAATRSTYLWFGVLFGLFCLFWLWLSRVRELPRLLFPLICYVGGIYLYASLVQGGLARRIGLLV